MRLGDEVDRARLHPGLHEGLRISRHVEDPQVRARHAEPLRDLLATHLRHDDIREQEVDSRLGRGELHRLGPRLRDEDAVACAGQDAFRHIAQRLFVLDQ